MRRVASSRPLAAMFLGPWAAFHKETVRIINLINDQEIIDEHHVRKM